MNYPIYYPTYCNSFVPAYPPRVREKTSYYVSQTMMYGPMCPPQNPYLQYNPLFCCDSSNNTCDVSGSCVPFMMPFPVEESNTCDSIPPEFAIGDDESIVTNDVPETVTTNEQPTKNVYKIKIPKKCKLKLI